MLWRVQKTVSVPQGRTGFWRELHGFRTGPENWVCWERLDGLQTEPEFLPLSEMITLRPDSCQLTVPTQQERWIFATPESHRDREKLEAHEGNKSLEVPFQRKVKGPKGRHLCAGKRTVFPSVCQGADP